MARSSAIPLLAIAYVLCVIGGSAHAPLMIEMARDLGAPLAQVQLSFPVYFLVYALFQLAVAPFGERVPRRKALVAAMAGVGVGSLACALAPSVPALLAGRVLQAAGACCGVLFIRVLTRDLPSDTDSSRALSVIAMATSTGLLLAPVGAGLLSLVAPWRALFALIAVLAVGAGALVHAVLPATRRPSAADGARPRFLGTYLALLRRPAYWAFMTANAGCYAMTYGFVAGIPAVFALTLGLGPEWLGPIVIAPALGSIAGAMTGRRLALRLHHATLVERGMLLLAAPSAAGLVLAAAGVPAIAVLVPVGLVWGVAMGLVQPNALVGAMSVGSDRPTAAAALIGATQILAGSLASGAAVLSGGSGIALLVAIGIPTIAAWAAWRVLRP